MQTALNLCTAMDNWIYADRKARSLAMIRCYGTYATANLLDRNKLALSASSSIRFDGDRAEQNAFALRQHIWQLRAR